MRPQRHCIHHRTWLVQKGSRLQEQLQFPGLHKIYLHGRDAFGSRIQGGGFMAEQDRKQSEQLFAEHGQFPRYTPHTVPFLNYEFHLPDVTSFLYQFKSIFGEDSYLFNARQRIPVIYDCGANVGTSCLYFRRKHPLARIEAYEADPAIFAYLKQNMDRNGCADVRLHQEAVWVREEPVDFACEGADGGCIAGPWATVPVPGIRLRDRLAAEDSIDFLKLDIEGAETAVLLDCADVLQKVRHIFVEYHSWVGKPQTLHELLGLLQQQGFRYYAETICNRATPFVDHGHERGMDYQSEIFARNERFIVG